MASRAQQGGAAGGVKEVTESYSEQFESNSQFYSQSVNKIVKPPRLAQVGRRCRIRRGGQGGGKVSPRRSGAEDLFVQLGFQIRGHGERALQRCQF